MTNSDYISLPKLDVQAAKLHPEQAALQLKEALETVGFLKLINLGHDYKPHDLLQCSKWFFSKPLDYKLGITTSTFEPKHSNHFRGYLPVCKTIHPLLEKPRNKELFDMGNFRFHGNYSLQKQKLTRSIVCEPNVWPTSNQEDQVKVNNFREILTGHFTLFSNISNMLVELLTLGFALTKEQTERLQAMFEQPNMSTARLFHYPEIPNQKGDVAMKAHTDRGLLTLLITFEYEGLQVFHKDEWEKVPSEMDTVIVNVGDLLQELLDNRVKATLHRVMDTGMQRFSFPFFYEPHFDAPISTSINGQSISGMPENERYGPWRARSLAERSEYRNVNFGEIN